MSKPAYETKSEWKESQSDTHKFALAAPSGAMIITDSTDSLAPRRSAFQYEYSANITGLAALSNPLQLRNEISGDTTKAEPRSLSDIVTPLYTVESLLNLYGEKIPQKIKNRILELNKEPYDRGAGDRPLDAKSVRCFLKYASKSEIEESVRLSATSSGLLQADWSPEPEVRVAMRFRTDGSIWIACHGDAEQGAWVVKADEFSNNRSIIQIRRKS